MEQVLDRQVASAAPATFMRSVKMKIGSMMMFRMPPTDMPILVIFALPCARMMLASTMLSTVGRPPTTTVQNKYSLAKARVCPELPRMPSSPSPKTHTARE